MGKIVPRKFRIHRGAGGVAGQAELIRKQGSGQNNAAAHAFASSGGGGGGGGGVVPGFPAVAARFDGATRLERGGALTGQADDQKFILSAWINIMADPGGSADVVFLSPPNDRFFLQLTTASKWQLFAQTNGAPAVWDAITSNLYDTVNNPGWHHLLASADGANTTRRHFYIDDVSAALDTDVRNAGTINFNNATNWGFGAAIGGGNEATMDFAQVYFNMGEYLDFSVEENRRKFISSRLKPTNVGVDGSVPTGTAPIVCFEGPVDDWHTNKGTGGPFTEIGIIRSGEQPVEV